MGRRKGSKNKKRSGYDSTSHKKKTIGLDFLGGILIVLGFIFIVFFKFENTGTLATAIKYLFTGLFGAARYILPIVLIYVGALAIASDKKINIASEAAKGIIMMICISSVIYIFTALKFDLFSNFVSHINKIYVGANVGTNLYGITGAFFASIIYLIDGPLVAKIIILSITLFFTLYFLNLGLREFFAGLYNLILTIIEFIANAFISVFGKDEAKQELREKKRREKELEKLRKKERELAENICEDFVAEPKGDWTEQLHVDLDKLEEKNKGKDKAKEQRDEFFKKQKEITEEKNIKEVLQLDHSTHEEEDEQYIFPPIDLMQQAVVSKKDKNSKQYQKATAIKLQKTLASFGVEAKVTNITEGPTVMRYELTPALGVKVSKIVNLADDIALNLAAKSIRIEAPIPGKGTVGIEIPNEIKETVYIRDIIDSEKFTKAESKLSFAVGKDAAGDIYIGDVGEMPHVLISGSTGSGKSVCINSILVSILYKAKPNEVKFILIDPKMVELSGFNGIPHLLLPVVTDPKKAAGALNWAVGEMVDRYTKFNSKNVKDIKGYNRVMEKEGEKKLPQIIIVIDELSDLMMVAANDVEDAICRLAQMARAAGMYLIIATQRPSVDVITGVIKVNIPSRIAFTVSSQVDSRTILDMAGAEKLLGKGDMLYFPTGKLKPERMQGAFVSEAEVENIVAFIKGNSTVKYSEEIIKCIEYANNNPSALEKLENEADILLEPAIDLVVDMEHASASMLQRRFKVGATRAGRIIDQMEERGMVSGYEGSKPRKVLISKEEWQEIKMSRETEDVFDKSKTHRES